MNLGALDLFALLLNVDTLTNSLPPTLYNLYVSLAGLLRTDVLTCFIRDTKAQDLTLSTSGTPLSSSNFK